MSYHAVRGNGRRAIPRKGWATDSGSGFGLGLGGQEF